MERSPARKMDAKYRVALVSVLAAVLLASTKLIVGLWTNSLGILSEALHSSLDLIASGVTMYAVWKAARPPDPHHPYGYAKVESLASLAETALLFVTCGWILWSAVDRLFFTQASVDVTSWAIGIMLMSIVVDFTRSRALASAAKKYKSQALEADAIHFSTDLISSVIVILGLGMTALGFASFDAIAAIGVALITAVIGYRLWNRSIQTLLDAAPAGLEQKIREEAAKVPGLRAIERVRIRESGPRTFVDATIIVDTHAPISHAHDVANALTSSIHAILPGADVVLHTRPDNAESARLVDRIRSEALRTNAVLDIHDILVTQTNEGIEVDFDIELDREIPLTQAHDIATDIEQRIRALDPNITAATSHIEPGNQPVEGATRADVSETLAASLAHILHDFPAVSAHASAVVKLDESKLKLTLTCASDGALTVDQAHDLATRIETRIRAEIPHIHLVYVHMEPNAP
ncbi:MAG: cation-efflux pump [Candidatus Thermoplasmatota archaeon]